MSKVVKAAKVEHEVAFQEIVDLMKKHAGDLDAIEMLAITANALGKMIAMQDQRRWTSPAIMEIIAANIELGNKQMIAQLSNTKGTA
jgi:hypothetical protein